MEKEFILLKSEINQIKEFEKSMREKNAQTINDFGRSELPRSVTDQIADTLVGKSAEFIFRAFAYQFGITTDIDLKVYPDQHVTDNGQDMPFVELTHRGWNGWYTNNLKVDIKATSNLSKWLLVEERKFTSNAYVLIRMDIPAGWEKTGIQLDRIRGEVTGLAWYTDLYSPKHNEPWFRFVSGQSLFHADNLRWGDFESPSDLREYLSTNKPRYMKMVLRSNSVYGLPINWLRSDRVEWEQLFNSIVTASL